MTTSQHRKWLGGVMVAALLAISAPVDAETLGNALVSAYQNSDLLDQNRAVLRAADEDVAGAVSTLRPVKIGRAHV